MNRRRASSRGSVRRPAPARARWVSASVASPSRAFASASHVRRGRGVERAADRRRDERDGALAVRRFVTPVAARLGQFRSGAERERAAVEFRQSAHARVRPARGTIRAQRLDEHGDAPGLEARRDRVGEAELGQRERAFLRGQGGEALDRFVGSMLAGAAVVSWEGAVWKEPLLSRKKPNAVRFPSPQDNS